MTMKFDRLPLHMFSHPLWRKTHNITGDAVFDASIEQSKNKDVAARLLTHVASGRDYGSKSAYNGYNGLSGDE
jgi:hypothetical protein